MCTSRITGEASKNLLQTWCTVLVDFIKGARYTCNSIADNAGFISYPRGNFASFPCQSCCTKDSRRKKSTTFATVTCCHSFIRPEQTSSNQRSTRKQRKEFLIDYIRASLGSTFATLYAFELDAFFRSQHSPFAASNFGLSIHQSGRGFAYNRRLGYASLGYLTNLCADLFASLSCTYGGDAGFASSNSFGWGEWLLGLSKQLINCASFSSRRCPLLLYAIKDFPYLFWPCNVNSFRARIIRWGRGCSCFGFGGSGSISSSLLLCSSPAFSKAFLQRTFNSTSTSPSHESICHVCKDARRKATCCSCFFRSVFYALAD